MDYFVSYRLPNGFGRCRLSLEKPVTCIEDVFDMEEKILADQQARGTAWEDGSRPLIMNWQKFEKPE